MVPSGQQMTDYVPQGWTHWEVMEAARGEIKAPGQ